MKKLINYVLNGEGLGAKYLLVLALVVSIIVSIMLRIGGSEAIPYAQSIADQMLPVKVQNGRVVTPADTLKIASLQIDGASDPIALPVVIDTRTDTLDTSQLKDGIYLTRTTLYTVNRNQVKLVRLEGSFELPRADYRETFKSLLNWFTVIFAVAAIAFLFVFYFLLTLFYALFAKFIGSLASRPLNFDQRMRLSSLALIAAYIIFYPLGWFNILNNTLIFFIVVIGLQAWGISKFSILVQPESKEENSDNI